MLEIVYDGFCTSHAPYNFHAIKPRSFVVRVWRKSVREGKIAASRRELEKNLFLLSPVFQEPLQRLKALCFDLAHQRLHTLQAGTVYTLEEFVAAQKQRTEEIEQVSLCGG